MLEVAIGFGIALMLGLTGVGAGVLTAPALLLILHTPAKLAIGTALIFGAVIKFVAAPNYAWRGQVNYRVLGWMLAGGLPGVLFGSILLDHVARTRSHLLLGIIGVIIVMSAVLNLWRLLGGKTPEPARDRRRWLPFVTLPIGLEFGFSSAGAGALGSVALMSLTSIAAGQIVGTDVFFGLGVSLLGGGWQFTAGNFDGALLAKLMAGGVLGALVGAHLSAIMPPRPLRFALSLSLISVGGQLCWRALGA